MIEARFHCGSELDQLMNFSEYSGSAMPEPVTVLAGPAVSILKSVVALVRKKFGKRKAKQLVSAVITELLKLDSDLTAAEAQLLAARASGAEPDSDFLRAKSMLRAAQSHRRKGAARRISVAAKAKWARVPAPKKRATKKKRRRK